MIQDERTENTILASILFSFDTEVCKGLALDAIAGVDEDCFSTPQRKNIFNSIKRAVSLNGTPDSVNVGAMLNADDLDILLKLAGSATTSDLTIAIKRIQEISKARKIENYSYGIPNRIKCAESLSNELQEIDREFLQLLSSGKAQISDEGFMHEFCGKWFEEKQRQMNTGETGYLSSGIQAIDVALGGFRGGDTVVIAGRPSMGKSSFATTMMVNQMLQGFKIALFSVELGRIEIFDKAVSMYSDIDQSGECVPFRTIHNPAGAFGGNVITQKQLSRVADIVKKYMSKTSFYARGTGRITIEEIMSKTRKLHHEGKCDALYIDHIGLLVRDKNHEREELTHITNSLRIFAGELKIPVFEVVQLGRNADNAKEKPKLSHLKGSGSIEEDASVVIMPWRPFAIDKENYSPEESEIIIAKGRNGGEGIIPTHFCTKTTRFTTKEDQRNEW